ncbi:hypothetical protein AYR56_10145 [Loigolactobacillus backii]|uniref:Glycosyltransferase 2-like domain-containing protein n=1 Tax=Loigolactobacillus backii TaxID=375175 RepID=A0A192H3H0_9LACO|nr:glycosyltransferase [Loigolactobacillus backii]ANK62506.1 hypothetical protein AYR53_06845 [Loigolactobacillus backii]ANK70482.1 hypothetical protein AYR56_10145 [Loigolactobacillus backii]
MEPDKERYTALISVYGKENFSFFETALNSIQLQTIRPTQIVIVKDGPLDDQLEKVIAKFKIIFLKENIECIIKENKVNRGLGYSLNKGLKFSSEELVARFDSDDINEPKRMEKTLEVFQSNKTLSVVGSYIDEFNEDSKVPLTKRTVPVTYGKIKSESNSRNPMNHMSVTLRKIDIEKVGGYEDVPYFEDYYLWMKLIKSGYKLVNIPEVLVHARANASFYKRRTGFSYLKKEIHFQYLLVSGHMISGLVFLRNIIMRGGARLLSPKKIRLIYRLLRKD